MYKQSIGTIKNGLREVTVLAGEEIDEIPGQYKKPREKKRLSPVVHCWKIYFYLFRTMIRECEHKITRGKYSY